MNLDDLSDSELDALIAMKSRGSAKAPADNFTALIEDASAKYGVPKEVLNAVIKQESAFKPKALSKVGAQGLMQLMPGTAKDLGVTDAFDPAQNIDGGTRYLAKQFKTFGSWPLAFAAYNAGPGNVRKHGGIPPFKETQGYVNNIVQNLGDFLATPAQAAATPSQDPLDDLSDEELDHLISLKTAPEVPSPEKKDDPFINRLLNRQRTMGMDERALQGVGTIFPPVAALIGMPRDTRTAITGGLQKFGKGATAGLSDPLAAAISAIMTGQEYSDVRGDQREAEEGFSKENPKAAMASELAGLFAPGGALSKSVGLGEKLAGKALPGALEKGAPFLKNMLARLIRGGTASGAIGLVNPDTPLADLPKEIALGAAIDPALGIFGKGANAIGKGAKYAKDFAYRTTKKLPGIGAPLEAVEEIVKNLKTEKVVDSLDDFARSHDAADDIVAGEGFQEKVKGLNDEIFSKYKDIKDPLLKKFGGDKASPKRLVDAINDKLRNVGLLDKDGVFKESSSLLKGPLGPEYRQIAGLRDELMLNPSLAEYETLVASIRDVPRFKGLYREGVEGLLDNLESSMVASGKRSKPISAARRSLENTTEEIARTSEEAKNPQLVGEQWDNIFAELQKVRSELNPKSKELKEASSMLEESLPKKDWSAKAIFDSQKSKRVIGGLEPEVEALKGKQSDLMSEITKGKWSKAEESRNTLQSLKGKQASEDDLLRDLLEKNQNAAAENVSNFRKGRQQFAKERPFIERLVDLSEKDADKIIRSSKSQLNKTFIKDAIETNPAFREPIKQAVLADIVKSTKDQKSLSKVLDTYGEDQLRLLFGQEFEAIKKLTASPESFLKGFMSRMAAKVPRNVKQLPTTIRPATNLLTEN